VLQLDFSIVNVTLPTIENNLHMAPAQLPWVVTGYALTFGSLLLAGGGCSNLACRCSRWRHWPAGSRNGR
jgi:MFS family permease